MAQARPLFNFDLNELPPPEEDCANHSASPDPVREPSPSQDPTPLPSEREPSPQDLFPPPVREPSPVLDLDAPLSPLDEDDAESQQLPGSPSLPEPRSSTSPVAPSRSSAEGVSDDDTTRLPGPPSRHCDRTPPRALSLPDGEAERPPSQDMSSASRAPTRGPSDTTTFHRPPRDDAISMRRRAEYDEDAASSYGRSSRVRPTFSRRYEQTGKRLAPATNAEFGGPRPKNRRRRRPEWPRGNKNQSYAQDQRTQKGYVSTQQGSLIADHRTIAVTIKRKDLPGLATISSTGKLFRSLVERTGAKVRTAAGRARCKNLPKPVGTVSTGRRLPSGHNVPERTGTTGNVGRIRRRKSTDPT
jgi:hypothetical protein